MYIKDTADIGKAIHTSRKNSGLTQDQLAIANGLGRRFIIDIERGKETCEIGKVLRVLQSCGIHLYTNQTYSSIAEIKKEDDA